MQAADFPLSKCQTPSMPNTPFFLHSAVLDLDNGLTLSHAPDEAREEMSIETRPHSKQAIEKLKYGGRSLSMRD